MNTAARSVVTLEPDDASRLARLNGQFDENLKQIERRLGVYIANRGNSFDLKGSTEAVQAAGEVLRQLYRDAGTQDITPDQVHLCLQAAGVELLTATPASQARDDTAPIVTIRTRKGTIAPRGTNQQGYVQAIRQHDINFGIGPAGTGKTYLAVACAVEALEQDRVQRIVLVRPAVEAGEKLGFLPGDLAQKVDPYLRPLYDALYEMLGFDLVGKLIERHVIEIAPLAFMRGRSLNHSFIILDEAQNTSREQMKMFLTRIGFGSTAVVTGDLTQIDLPRGSQSGLGHALTVLDGVAGISFTRFNVKDVIRHPLVQRIVEAYDRHEDNAREHGA